jgi:hypothetical protein
MLGWLTGVMDDSNHPSIADKVDTAEDNYASDSVVGDPATSILERRKTAWDVAQELRWLASWVHAGHYSIVSSCDMVGCQTCRGSSQR